MSEVANTKFSTECQRRFRKVGVLSRLMAPSFSFMKILHLVSFLAVIYAIVFLQFEWIWWAFAVLVYFLTGCVGLTVTLHRSLTHKSVEFPKLLEYLFTLLGAIGGTGSSIAWTAMHRAHHAHVDSNKDPHSPELLGWTILFSHYDYEFDPRHAKDLLRDPFHVVLHRFYTPIIVLWAVILFSIDWRFGMFGFLVPVFLQITISNLTTILTHSHGYKNFQTRDESANNWVIAVLAWGEGWHNNHHAKPWNPIFGYRWWEIDPGGAFIVVMHGLGLARLNGSKRG